MTRNPALLAEIFESCQAELVVLKDRKDLSSYVEVNRLLAKSFLMSCASFYEDTITEVVRTVLAKGGHPSHVRKWLESVAVEGQFYKWFSFRSATNTNPFLATFGQDFKRSVRAVIDNRTARRQAETDFLLLCQSRNECVHRNYAAFSLGLTLDELYKKHKSAMRYVRVVEHSAEKWLV